MLAYHNRIRTTMQRRTSSSTASTPFQEHPHHSDMDDLSIMNDWHSEWETAPRDPLPSNPDRLFLLNKLAMINLKLHSSRARKVKLIAWDGDHMPEGVRDQLKRWARERSEPRLKKDAEELAKLERSRKRVEVSRAAKEADVIDLTGDGAENRRAHQKHRRCAAIHQRRQTGGLRLPQSPRSRTARAIPSMSAASRPADQLVALPTALAPSGPFQQQRPQPQYQPATSAMNSGDFSHSRINDYATAQDTQFSASRQHDVPCAFFGGSFTQSRPATCESQRTEAYY